MEMAERVLRLGSLLMERDSRNVVVREVEAAPGSWRGREVLCIQEADLADVVDFLKYVQGRAPTRHEEP